VELDVLGVDDAGAGAIGHGEPVARGAFGIGGMQKDLPQTASGKHRGAREHRPHDLLSGIVHVRAHARDRLVDGQAVQRVMGRRQQIHCDVFRQHVDIRPRAQCLDQFLLDGAPGVVVHVQDAVGGMDSLAGALQLARGIPCEGHLQPLDKQLAHQARAVRRQYLHGGTIVHAIPGAYQIFGQQLGGIVHALVDDATLCIVGVRFQRIRRLHQQRDLRVPIRRQAQRRRCTSDATTNDEDVSFYQFRQVSHWRPSPAFYQGLPWPTGQSLPLR